MVTHYLCQPVPRAGSPYDPGVLPDGSTIVVTGVTGQVADPVALALAGAGHQVVGRRPISRRGGPGQARGRWGALRARRLRRRGTRASYRARADFVCNFAVAKSNDWTLDLDANVGGLATLMEHHQGAAAFLHCSTTAVYKPMGHHVFAEDDELGDNHGVWPFLRTYSICKIAAEAMARWAARRFDLPTTIARLSVPYGDAGGGRPSISR